MAPLAISGLLTLAHSNKIRDAFLQPRSCLMPIVVIILAVSLMAGVAIALSLLRSKRLADISSASLSSGLAHPRLAFGVAFFLCGYATFVLWASRSVEVLGSPAYYAFSPLAATLCALLYCAWVFARTTVVWHKRTRLWRCSLSVLMIWLIAVFVAHLALPAHLTSRAIGH
jgi:hypothetical protein